MKTDYPLRLLNSKGLRKFTSVGTIISLLLTTVFSSLFIPKVEALDKKELIKIDSLIMTNADKISIVKTNAEDSLEKAIVKIQKEEEEKRIELEKQRKKEEEERMKIVYDGLTLDELASKLERSLNGTLSGQGYFFAKYSTSLGLDPYLALAITLHETGCKWNCSTLVRECYNVGGMKGSPGCNGGSYKKFNSLSEGISSYLNNLYNNYYSLGLTTPEAIGPKYAASTTWASQVNSYINEIKAK